MTDNAFSKRDQLILDKIRKRSIEISRNMYQHVHAIEDVAMAETAEHLSFEQGRKLPYKRVKSGTSWGKPWSTAWFRLRLTIPSKFKGYPVSLQFSGGESILFRDGKPVQAFDMGRDRYRLLECARGGETFELFVESGANDAFGNFWAAPSLGGPTISAELTEVVDAWHDVCKLLELVRSEPKALPDGDTFRAVVIRTLDKAVNAFDYRDRTAEGRIASAKRVRKILRPLFAHKAAASAQTFALMGHAHIDVAWMWPMAETVRKCARTFSNVLELIERYPGFIHCQSQPQVYEFTKRRYPWLYRQVKKAVAVGRVVPTGCCWVEPDLNITSGESLVRQILFGTRFFREEFGHEAATFWVPDTFGYTASLPQIMARSGIRYFLSCKVLSNQFTRFPYNSFYWEGIDGTKVLAHLPGSGNYGMDLTPAELIKAAQDYREKDRSPIQLAMIGYGDGGGGPNVDMLERAKRFNDLEGLPKLEAMTPRRFFQRLESESEDLPTWMGEIYFELHRGTYTTQAKIKKYNRRCELLLREVEALAAVNAAAGRRAYPQRQLNDIWKTVLCHQFHDILPGSSIVEVNRVAHAEYEKALATLEELRDKAADAYLKTVDTRGEGVPIAAINALSWERDAVITVDAAGLGRKASLVATASDGVEAPVQFCSDGKARFHGTLPSMGHAVFHLRRGKTDALEIHATERGMENDRVRLRFDKAGRLKSVFDKRAKREVLAERAVGNQFLLFEDKPVFWDAWDIDIYYQDKLLETDGRFVSGKVIETGPVRSVLRLEREISQSRIIQDVILHAGSARIDFATTVHWGDERDVMLKVAFPVSVLARTARYEVQFGNYERPTHGNTPFDWARVEVCGQRWADLSETDYGVALLNDCKYGYDIRDNVMRLTLLKAPLWPDATADINQTHTFTYSLLPHEGDFAAGGVVRSAAELNDPVHAMVRAPRKGARPAMAGWFLVTGGNVIIDTVKQCEDDDGLIVRMYEAHGCRGRRTLQTALPVKRVIETDLMEREERKLTIRNGRITLDFKPYQIRTVKLLSR